MIIKTIGVVGMGYVGIPSAVLFADNIKYDKVYGFQRNSKSSGYKINMLNNGESPLIGNEPELSELLRSVIERKKFECTSDFSKLAECDAITISIQTPFLHNTSLNPDLSALEDGLIKVGKYMSKEKRILVVLESTITPGTTIGYAKDILERESGMRAGCDFLLAHAPERVMVGRLIDNIRNHDRIVGGIDTTSTLAASILYSPVLKKGKIIPMSSTAAEVTKTAENTFRDLQIAASNQLALYCEAIGVNFYDVKSGIDSLKGEGITRAMLFPGAGVGGHCLTKDTYHLERGAHEHRIDYPMSTPSLYVIARRINDFMPTHMFNLTIEAVRRLNTDINPKVAILGWSFLPDTNDARNSPSESYASCLIEHSIDYQIHDPYVDGMNTDFVETISNSDVLAIFTAHSQYKRSLEDPFKIKTIMNKDHPIIIDGRNMIDPDNFIKNGFIYKGIGRGDKNNHKVM